MPSGYARRSPCSRSSTSSPPRSTSSRQGRFGAASNHQPAPPLLAAEAHSARMGVDPLLGGEVTAEHPLEHLTVAERSLDARPETGRGRDRALVAAVFPLVDGVVARAGAPQVGPETDLV